MKKILCVIITLVFLASSTSGMLIKQDSILKTTNRSDKYFEQCDDNPKFTMNAHSIFSSYLKVKTSC